MLHSAVDSFIAPEPGTEPADHLLRGFASTGLLALVIVGFPSLRTGARAAVAGALGVLALEGAALALADACAVGVYYRAASPPKTIRRIPEAGHVGGLETRPREYEMRVIRFFDNALSVSE